MFFYRQWSGRWKKVAHLLSGLGTKTYAGLKNLTAPDPLSGCSLERIKEVLINHFKPKPPVIDITAEDIFARLAGGRVFTKLDLSQAYLQLPVDDDSKDLLVINTPKGLFRYNWLPYGVSIAPAIFQSVLDRVLHNLPVTCYLDDI